MYTNFFKVELMPNLHRITRAVREVNDETVDVRDGLWWNSAPLPRASP